MPELIDLGQNRTVSVRQGGRLYSVTFAPIAQDVWFEFFGAIETRSERKGSSVRNSISIDRALRGLVQKASIAADGYPNLPSAPGWQNAIPEDHQLIVGEVLIEAYPSDDQASSERTFQSARAVRLEALWSAGSTGAMRRHKGLVHYFCEPSPEHHQRYRDAYLSFEARRGACKRGAGRRPLDPFGARALTAIYDELIEWADGYAIKGEPLDTDREAIGRSMDTFHKVGAARQLFQALSGFAKTVKRSA